jgi:hypothetical protein
VSSGEAGTVEDGLEDEEEDAVSWVEVEMPIDRRGGETGHAPGVWDSEQEQDTPRG